MASAQTLKVQQVLLQKLALQMQLLMTPCPRPHHRQLYAAPALALPLALRRQARVLALQPPALPTALAGQPYVLGQQ